jgi:hypothetical protein
MVCPKDGGGSVIVADTGNNCIRRIVQSRSQSQFENEVNNRISTLREFLCLDVAFFY